MAQASTGEWGGCVQVLHRQQGQRSSRTLVLLRIPREDLLLPPNEVSEADSKADETDADYKDAKPGRCASPLLKSTILFYCKCLVGLCRHRPFVPVFRILPLLARILPSSPLSALSVSFAIPPPLRPRQPAASEA